MVVSICGKNLDEITMLKNQRGTIKSRSSIDFIKNDVVSCVDWETCVRHMSHIKK
jgi:hypothetical protein